MIKNIPSRRHIRPAEEKRVSLVESFSAAVLGGFFMLTRLEKENRTRELTEQFQRQKIAVFSDFRGISVMKMRELRKQLKQKGARYKVSKKTLLNRALKDAGIELDTKTLEGEIAVTFINEEDVEPVKNLVRFEKGNNTFKNRAGLMGTRIIGVSEIMALAKLPSRDILLAQVFGTMQGSLREFLNVLEGNIRNFVNILGQIRDKKV